MSPRIRCLLIVIALLSSPIMESVVRADYAWILQSPKTDPKTRKIPCGDLTVSLKLTWDKAKDPNPNPNDAEASVLNNKGEIDSSPEVTYVGKAGSGSITFMWEVSIPCDGTAYQMEFFVKDSNGNIHKEEFSTAGK